MWISFQEKTDWKRTSRCVPFALRAFARGVNVVSGEPMRPNMATFLKTRNGVARKQDYVFCPRQHWLDGAAIRPGVVRQFVAVPYASGPSIEEQMTGLDSVGGIQIEVVPATSGMRIEVYTFRQFYVHLYPDDTVATLVKTIEKRDGAQGYTCRLGSQTLQNGRNRNADLRLVSNAAVTNHHLDRTKESCNIREVWHLPNLSFLHSNQLSTRDPELSVSGKVRAAGRWQTTISRTY